MKFELGIRECHYLENNGEITLNGNLKLTYLNKAGARYKIKLDESKTKWIYSKVDRERRDRFGRFCLIGDWKQCRVQRKFRGLSSYNH